MKAPRIGEAEAEAVVSLLGRAYPEARCELDADGAWELLVAAICSARTPDARVNEVLPGVRERFAAMHDCAAADRHELEGALRRLPLFRQKARAINEAARYCLRVHGGEVPATLETLVRIPGVGRKTAAVVVGNHFGVPAIAADVHVQRAVRRWAWAERENPHDAERAIAGRIPPHYWVELCHQTVRLGRDCCRPLRPWCSRCPLADQCPQAGVEDAR